jgi:hypothetical protein
MPETTRSNLSKPERLRREILRVWDLKNFEEGSEGTGSRSRPKRIENLWLGELL